MGDLANMLTNLTSQLVLPADFKPIDYESEHESCQNEPLSLPFSQTGKTSDITTSTLPLPFMDKPESTSPKSLVYTTNFLNCNDNVDCSNNNSPRLYSDNELQIDCEEVVESQQCMDNSLLSSPGALRPILSNSSTLSNSKEFLSPVTPTKPSEGGGSIPLTPTANLKMLMNAASPEIRNMEKRQKQERLFNAMIEVASKEQVSQEQQNCRRSKKFTGYASENVDDGDRQSSRKSKSLGLLCERFMERYPMYPVDNAPQDISLDVIAKELKVERRRIYDIINVLESVEIVSRKGKNQYMWHGHGNIINTLKKLKYLGKHFNFSDQVEYIKKLQEENDVENQHVFPLAAQESQANVLKDVTNVKPHVPVEFSEDGKKEKSLGVMSQKFIMLFLQSKSKVITLDVAARVLYGELKYEVSEKSKFKTKVRRLYDIANILSSLKMIKKIYVHENRGRKPAFEWIGNNPDIDCMSNDEIQKLIADSEKRLNPVAEYKRKLDMIHSAPSKKKRARSKSPWSRHASLNIIPSGTVEEHRSCSSAPSSPEKIQNAQDDKFQQAVAALWEKYPTHMTKLLSPSAGSNLESGVALTGANQPHATGIPITPVTPLYRTEHMNMECSQQATRALHFPLEDDGGTSSNLVSMQYGSSHVLESDPSKIMTPSSNLVKPLSNLTPYFTPPAMTVAPPDVTTVLSNVPSCTPHMMPVQPSVITSPSPGSHSAMVYQVKKYISLLTPNTLMNVQSQGSPQPGSVVTSSVSPPISSLSVSRSSPSICHQALATMSGASKASQNVIVVVQNNKSNEYKPTCPDVEPVRKSQRPQKPIRFHDFEYAPLPNSNSSCFSASTKSAAIPSTSSASFGSLAIRPKRPLLTPAQTNTLATLGTEKLAPVEQLAESSASDSSSSTQDKGVTQFIPLLSPAKVGCSSHLTDTAKVRVQWFQAKSDTPRNKSPSHKKDGAKHSKRVKKGQLSASYTEGMLHVRRKLVMGCQSSSIPASPESPSTLQEMTTVTNSSNSSLDSVDFNSPPTKTQDSKLKPKTENPKKKPQRCTKLPKCKSENMDVGGGTPISWSRGSLGSQEEMDKILHNNLDSPVLAYLRSRSSQEPPSPLMTLASPQSTHFHNLPKFISQAPSSSSIVIPSPTPGVLVSPTPNFVQTYTNSPMRHVTFTQHVTLNCGTIGALSSISSGSPTLPHILSPPLTVLNANHNVAVSAVSPMTSLPVIHGVIPCRPQDSFLKTCSVAPTSVKGMGINDKAGLSTAFKTLSTR